MGKNVGMDEVKGDDGETDEDRDGGTLQYLTNRVVDCK